MAVGFKTRVIGGEEYRRYVKSVTPSQNRRISRRLLEKIVGRVQTIAAKQKIVPGRGLKAAPLASKLSFRRGGAAGSIGPDFSGLPAYAEVGSILDYPMFHEFGLGRFPKRPWLEPAIDDVVPNPAERWMAEIWENAGGATT